MKNRRFIFNAILLITISISFAAATAFAQSSVSGEILVDGNPPFTQSDFESIVKFYERGLDIRFSGDERDELQAKITATWRKHQKSNGKSLSGFMQTVKKLNTVPDEKVRANQQEFTDGLLADLRAMERNGWSQFVIDVYEKSRNGGSNDETSNAAQNQSNSDDNERSSQTETVSTRQTESNNSEPDFRPIAGAIKISDLVGKWNKGSVASYGYRSQTTNDYKSGYGAANQHDIYANGSFDYTNYAQVSLYNCTTELSTSMKGRVTVSGSQITFTYVSGTVKGKDSCKTEGFTKPAQIRATTYRVERDARSNQIRLCEAGAEQPTCIYKE